MQGWIKLHRGITTHWIFKDADKFKAWVTILATVNHKENKSVMGDSLFLINRGESIKSLDTWAKLFGTNWNKSKVRRFFKLLESDSMIETKSERKTTRLKVCNYDSYQGERNDNETILKRKRNDNETIVTPNKNVKKEKNENKFNFKQSLLNLNIDVDVANDWMIVRKNGKAANTKTAFNSFKAQVEKSGKSANECVKLCVIKSWKGFNASWLANVDDFDMSEHKQLDPKLRYATVQDLLPDFKNEQAIIEKQKENTYVCNGDGKIFPLRNKDGSRNREGDYILGSDKKMYKITI